MISGVASEVGSEVASARRIAALRAAVAALAALVVVLGAAVAVLLAPRVLPVRESSVEVGFVRDMYVHHDQAVLMAMAVRERTGDADLDTFAADVVEGQSEQQGRMLAWLDARGVPATSSEYEPMTWAGGGGGHAGMGAGASGAAAEEPVAGMGMADAVELRRLTSLPAEEAEVLFLRLMERHHLAAVAMAQDFLRLSDDAELRPLAEAVVSGQRRELDLIEDMLLSRTG